MQGSARLRELQAVHDEGDSLMAKHLHALEARQGTAERPLSPRQTGISGCHSPTSMQPDPQRASGAHSHAHPAAVDPRQFRKSVQQHVQATQTSASLIDESLLRRGPDHQTSATQSSTSLFRDLRRGAEKQPQATQTPELVLQWRGEGEHGTAQRNSEVWVAAGRLGPSSQHTEQPLNISAEAHPSEHTPLQLRAQSNANNSSYKAVTDHSTIDEASLRGGYGKAGKIPDRAAETRQSLESNLHKPAVPSDALESIRMWYADADDPDTARASLLERRRSSIPGVTSQTPAISRTGSAGLLPWDRDDSLARISRSNSLARDAFADQKSYLPEPSTVDLAVRNPAQTTDIRGGDILGSQRQAGVEPLTSELAKQYLAQTAAEEAGRRPIDRLAKPEPLTLDLAARYLAETAAVSSRSQEWLRDSEQRKQAGIGATIERKEHVLVVDVSGTEPEAARKERRRSRKAAKAAAKAALAEDDSQGQLSGWETQPASR